MTGQRFLPPFARLAWASPGDNSDPGSNAHERFGITAVPTAFLIDRTGQIVWRGHPASIEVEKRIEAMLKPSR
jgi:hypothetical protein